VEEESRPVLFSGTILAFALASKHYGKSHIYSAETVRISGAFRMLLQLIFLARLQIS